MLLYLYYSRGHAAIKIYHVSESFLRCLFMSAYCLSRPHRNNKNSNVNYVRHKLQNVVFVTFGLFHVRMSNRLFYFCYCTMVFKTVHYCTHCMLYKIIQLVTISSALRVRPRCYTSGLLNSVHTSTDTTVAYISIMHA